MYYFCFDSHTHVLNSLRILTSNLYHSVLFQWGFSDFRHTSVLWVTPPNLISTKASVVSLALSITGRLRPANTFTFILPGIFYLTKIWFILTYEYTFILRTRHFSTIVVVFIVNPITAPDFSLQFLKHIHKSLSHCK